jgi:hypothetical protein
MRYFINAKKEIYGVDTGQEALIRPDWVEISEEKVAELTAPTAEQLKQERIYELQNLLKNSDYKVLPDYDQPNDEVKAQRQSWREEIRQLTT